MWCNSADRYGRMARLLHWGMMPLLLGLLGMGLWLTQLDYYHPWYHKATTWHEGLGVLAFLLFSARWAWRCYTPPPDTPSLPHWEQRLARLTHRLLYLLMGLIPGSGYLISTAKGAPLMLFDRLPIPALFGKVVGMEEVAGAIHLRLGLALVALVVLHLLATLKHHWLDKDHILSKML